MRTHHVIRDEEGLWIVTEPESHTGGDWANRVAPKLAERWKSVEFTTTDLAEAEAYLQRQIELEG